MLSRIACSPSRAMPFPLLSLPTALLVKCLAFLPWTQRLTVCSSLAKDLQPLCDTVQDQDHLLVQAAFIAVGRGGRSTALQWLCKVRSLSIGSVERSAEDDVSTPLADWLRSLSPQPSLLHSIDSFFASSGALYSACGTKGGPWLITERSQVSSDVLFVEGLR